jgi:hypothetical protein
VPTPATELDDRFDRVAELLERNAKAFAEYQAGFSQSVAHYIAFDQATQVHLRSLVAIVESQAHVIAAVAKATTDFARAADERVARVERAVDAIGQNMIPGRGNGKTQ